MSLLHSVYAYVPDTKLEKVYHNLNKRYDDEYPPGREWKPHVDVLTWRVDRKNSDEYIRRLMGFNNKLPFFKVEVNCLRLRSSGKFTYLTLEMSSETVSNIMYIREQLSLTVKDLVDSSIPSFYKKNWGSFTSIQKKRIKEIGSPHKYSPHITIIKLGQIEAKQARKDLEMKGLEKLSWNITELFISRQKGKCEFPVQGEIKLQNYSSAH